MCDGCCKKSDVPRVDGMSFEDWKTNANSYRDRNDPLPEDIAYASWASGEDPSELQDW